MLWAIAIVLAVLWAVGFFIARLGDLVHLLLVVALFVVVGNYFRGAGRRGAP